MSKDLNEKLIDAMGEITEDLAGMVGVGDFWSDLDYEVRLKAQVRWIGILKKHLE